MFLRNDLLSEAILEMKFIAAILVILLVLLQYPLWFGDGSFSKVWKLQNAVEIQKEKNNKLEDRNASLEAEVLDLKQGLDAIEERARTELGMIKQGETFFQVVNENSTDKNER